MIQSGDKPVDPGRLGFRHDPDVVGQISDAIVEAGITFAAYVPDTILHPVMAALEDHAAVTAVSASREDEATAIAMGAFLGGHWPVLLMEGSGLGMSATILARAVVQRTPFLILASHNQALGERHDYLAAGRRVTEPLLSALNIPHVVARSGQEAPELIREAQLTVIGDRSPVGILFPRHTLHAKEGVA